MILSDKIIKQKIEVGKADCFSINEELTNESGIYMIESSDGRIYIGQSINLKRRYDHYCRKHFKGQKLLYAVCSKYGCSNFLFKVLEKCKVSVLDEREIYYIDFYKSNYSKYPKSRGLNLADGGATNKGYKPVISEKVREIRRQQAYSKEGVATRVKNNPLLVTGKANPFYNKKHSELTRSTMGVSKRKPFTALSPTNEVVEFQSVYEFAEKIGCHISSPNKCLSIKSKLKTVRGWSNFKFIKHGIE